MKLGDPIKMPEFNLRTVLAAVCVALGVLDIVLIIKVSMAIFTAHAVSASEMQARQLQIKAQQLELAPMKGLDQKLADSTKQADRFYDDRLPSSTSAVASELGHLAQSSGVNLSRVGYGYKAAGNNLTQVRMDCALSGDYAPLMKFINSMERDNLFFVIRGIAFSGQQAGLVNLRLTADTYMREGVPQVAAAAGKGPADGTEGAATPQPRGAQP